MNDPQRQHSDDEKESISHVEHRRVSDTDSESNDPHYVAHDDNKRVLRKADMYMMPVFCAIVALQFLDKTALTYTSVMGLAWDTKLKGDQYGWLGTIFSFGFLLGQYPMCYLQQRLPLAKFTAFNIIAWGTCVASMAACNNFTGLMIARFFLGVFESSISPALILFTAQWYRKREQGARTGVWASFTTWGGILGAGVAYALFRGDQKKRYNMKGWRILFIFFGTTTIFIGILFALIVPDSPRTAWFLTEKDKEIAERRTAENMEAIGEKKWRWYQVKEACTDPQVIMMVFVALLNSIPNGGITNFYALMVVGIGIEIGTGILLSMINCWVAVVTIISLVLGDKFKRRTLFCAAPHVISMIGGILLWKLPIKERKARLASFYLTLVYAIAMTGCMSLISSNIAGRTKKTTVSALFFIFYCVGNLIGPQTFRAKQAPRYIPAVITIVVCNILTVVTMLCLFVYYKRENKRRDRLAAETGAAAPDPTALAEHVANQQDLTDRENLHFRYTL